MAAAIVAGAAAAAIVVIVVIAAIASALTSGSPTPQAGPGNAGPAAASTAGAVPAAPSASASSPFGSACLDHTIQSAVPVTGANLATAVRSAWDTCVKADGYSWHCILQAGTWSCFGIEGEYEEILTVTVKPDGSGFWAYSGV
jgi:hypothetical protein